MAGTEAAWALAQAGVPVVLHEMRPHVVTDAHKTDGLAELVCSNSFRSDDKDNNAVGLLHEEMRMAGSLVMAVAALHQVPAGGALAVDRDGFSAEVTRRIEAHPLITIQRGEVAGLPPADWDNVIIATGPLTSPALADAVRSLTGATALGGRSVPAESLLRSLAGGVEGGSDHRPGVAGLAGRLDGVAKLLLGPRDIPTRGQDPAEVDGVAGRVGARLQLVESDGVMRGVDAHSRHLISGSRRTSVGAGQRG